MSDSTEDRRHRGRRGSLLDHARDAQPAAPEPVIEPVTGFPEAGARTGRASSASNASLLTTPTRSARISTSRFAEPGNQAPARSAPPLLASAAAKPAAPRPAAARPQLAAVSQPSPGRERFGDRIARLIGTIAPEARPAEPRAVDAGLTADEPAPVHPVAEAQPGPGPENHSRAAARPEPSPVDPDRPRDRQRDDRYDGDDHYHWHAASGGGQFEDGTRPLLDASILISAVWRFRRLIAAATVAGAMLGVLMALSTPHRYYAESRLFVDPREIRVTEDDIRNQQLSTEAMLAITDSQLQILSSTSVLEKVIEDLGLDRDPEFNGSMSSGGISGGLSLIRELFTGKNATTEGEQKALNNLRKALSVGRDAKTFVIIVGVDTRDPEKSALIANQIVETYLDSEGQAQSSLLERTSESIDTRINSLRADLDAAEREVERFKAENGLVGVGGQYIDDKEILALSDQLANARAMKVGIRVKADNLARVKIDDVLSGAFPEELLSANLSELRKQYAQTKSNADSLATRLGPRHPQYIAAMQSLETITNEISAELRRIVASSQTELQRAVETEQELASQMAVAKSRAIDQSVELVTLRELERKANATRGIYEAFLTRSRETSERSNLSTRNVRVISPAEAPLQPMGPSRKFIAIGGMIAGFLAGLGLALLAGAIESIRAYNGMQAQARYPGSASGGYPQPPSPGPQTPPGGPGQRFWPSGSTEMPGRDAAFGAAAAQPWSGKQQPVAENPAQSEPLAGKPGLRETFHLGLLRPKPIREQAPRSGAAAAQTAAFKPEVEPVGDHDPQRTSATGRNAQAFMAGHGQVHDEPQQLAPVGFPGNPVGEESQAAQPFPPAPTPHQHSLPPAQPAGQPPVQQPVYPYHPAYAADPHAQVHTQVHAQAPVYPVYQPAYPVGPAVHPYPAPPQMMPGLPPQTYPLPPHAYQPQPQMPQHPYPAAYQTPPLYPVQQPLAPAQAWQQQVTPPLPQPAPPAPAMPVVQPQAQAQTHAHPQQPAGPAPAPVPVARDNAAAERIRREMDDLRSRIDSYGADRRRA
ncbi:GNVR domain-containing protein [Hoeflea alexandrii]|uniref:GNVR domain-containing protein n=1 Tax=Hoeflea alexandrii TaxID=288436 RepID=UPI0022AF7C13|nr:GNVR domain-containing protein [Hoeflea alexandrii]MCZ4290545.1 Wzz/FepE/Etk N-terminal domain-containing protein [Hoeflea alexandrii]